MGREEIDTHFVRCPLSAASMGMLGANQSTVFGHIGLAEVGERGFLLDHYPGR